MTTATFDPLIHHPRRLRILATLTGTPPPRR